MEYSVSNITVMEGLDAVRMRPGMYIGTTGPKGLHHLLWEIVDNAVDEAANGYANEISVTLNKDGSATVSDNGRGIPVGIHEKLGVSGVEVVFTQQGGNSAMIPMAIPAACTAWAPPWSML